MGRINVDIDDNVHHGLKIYAVKQKLTLPDAVNELLKIALEAKSVLGP